MLSLNKIERSQGYYEVFKDGKICNDVLAYRSAPMAEDEFEFLARSYKGSKSLTSCQFNDFYSFSVIELKDLFEWLKLKHWLIISNVEADKNSDTLDLAFGIVPKLIEWNEKYSFGGYLTAFEEFWDKDSTLKGEIRVLTEESVGIEISIRKPLILKETILECINLFEIELRLAHENTEHLLLSVKSDYTINTIFDFPEDFRIPCKQYLLYFAQFLKDLGISTTSNLKEEAGKVLFSVMPIDDVEALDKIREALVIYLNLPSSPIVYGDSFAAVRLQQQIENLQHSQRMTVRELQLNEKLLVAQADIIHEKNLIISHQQSVIEQQNKIIEKISSKSIMIDSVENKEELEELYDGLKIGESKFLKEQLGIHLNPAKVIKTAVKNTFGKEDGRKSVLGLDEEPVKDDN